MTEEDHNEEVIDFNEMGLDDRILKVNSNRLSDNVCIFIKETLNSRL